MPAIQQTLMQGLDEANLTAVINTYDFKQWYYPTLFSGQQNLVA